MIMIIINYFKIFYIIINKNKGTFLFYEILACNLYRFYKYILYTIRVTLYVTFHTQHKNKNVHSLY